MKRGVIVLDVIFGRFRPLESRGASFALGGGIVLLACRLLLAAPFWASGQTRWVHFPTEISGSTLYLFENLFVLHFGLFDLPIPFPVFTAHVTALAEIILPVLLVAGLFTRFAALGLFAMSVVIELVFPEAFFNQVDPLNSHALWMALGLVLTWAGPGVLSLDEGVRRFILPRIEMRTA